MSTRANTGAAFDSTDLCQKLRAYTVENLAKIERGELAGSHLLGVAAKAINLFETVICEPTRAAGALSRSGYCRQRAPKRNGRRAWLYVDDRGRGRGLSGYPMVWRDAARA
jgi:hypothetical protein